MLHAESVTFVTDDGWRWEFELTFLLSSHSCIFGNGCPSIRDDGSTVGCCTIGAPVVHSAKDTRGAADLERLQARVAALTEEDWQNKAEAERRGGPFKARFGPGTAHTRVHRGACIFHNHDEHPGGPGCALHQAAISRGEDPIDWKPWACSLAPLLRATYNREKRVRVRHMHSRDWGGTPGWVKWWCTEQEAAYGGGQPVYRSMERVLRRLAGDAMYEELAAYCDARLAREPPVLLPMHQPVGQIALPMAPHS